MTQSETITVKIHGLSFYEGHGVGRSEDGKIYFVDQACPGDLVEVDVYKEKKNYSFAKINKLVEASADRVTPPCKVFDKCGGCSIQHTSYSLQIAEKHNVLKRYQEKAKKNFDLHPFEPATEQFHYRNRIEVHVKNKKWGFFQKKSNSLVYPNECMVIRPELNTKLNESNLVDGDYHVDLNGIQLRTRGNEGVFQQINPEINLKLKNYLLSCLKIIPTEITHFYDLFAGSGNYSLFLSEKYPEINFYCVELSRKLVEIGKHKSSNEKNILWVQDSVEHFLTSNKNLKSSNSLMLVNPPRDGLNQRICDTITQSGQKYLIYVSCNPMTMFRDIDALGPKASLVSLKGFDMFPQTMHFETVSLIKLY